MLYLGLVLKFLSLFLIVLQAEIAEIPLERFITHETKWKYENNCEASCVAIVEHWMQSLELRVGQRDAGREQRYLSLPSK